MKLYTTDEYKTVSAIYGNIKGAWAYISDMCVLEKPSLLAARATDYFKADHCPVIDIHYERNTKLYNFSGRKSSSEPTQSGQYVLQALWVIFDKCYANMEGSPQGRGTLPDAVKVEIWCRRFGDKMYGSCICCGGNINAIASTEYAHIIPHSTGGTMEWDNMIPTCKTCNRNCGTINMKDWMRTYFPARNPKFTEELDRYLSSDYPLANT